MQDDSVFHTGAGADEFLEGAEEANEGLRIQVRTRQPRGLAGPVRGKFVLVDPGIGPYSRLLADFRGVTLSSAKQLLDTVRADPGGKRCTHILNCNMLRRGAPLAKPAPPPIVS
jgi:hypothetical protein